MARNNSIDLDVTNQADGVDIKGGVIQRLLRWLGSDITLTGAGTNVYTFPSATDTLVGRASTDVLTNKTLTSPVLNTQVTGDAVLDEDDMASNSAIKVATQQSIKAYVDGQVVGESPKSKVSSNDTTAGYLNGKLVAGTGITLTENNNGANETLGIATTITQYTDEMAQDAIGLVVGTGLAYDDGTGAVSLSHLGIQSLADPNANELMGWDDTDGAVKFIVIGAGLAYDHTTHTLTGNMVGELSFDRTTINADDYLGSATLAYTAAVGRQMNRAGSIIGISVMGTFTEVTPGNVTFYSKISNTNKLSVTVTTSGSNTYSAYASQARNTAGQTFVAGDFITVYADFDTFVGTIAPVVAVVFVQYDS